MMSGGGYSALDDPKASRSVPAATGPDPPAIGFTDSKPEATSSSSSPPKCPTSTPTAQEGRKMEEAAAAVPQQARSAAPVAVIARIFPGGTGSFQVAACARNSSAVVSILPRHEEKTSRQGTQTPCKEYDYTVDCCYTKDDDSCHKIFKGEIKPLVDAIFRGTNSCVIACGASAKTNLIMGQSGGLLNMAMKEIFRLSQTIGATVSVSSYQVIRDTHVFDVLEPKVKEVLVLEDGNGRTNLKGLSRVYVKSIQEFEDLCCCGTDMLKHPTKPTNHVQPTTGHRGFIIYVSSIDQQGKECVVARMDFLDLAGYVQKNHGGPNCNMSIYALMNVVQALNKNQSSVHYRQSKLTRILQDSLCKTSKAVLIACLDEFSSQDAISTLSLASRSSQMVSEQNNLSRSLLPSTRQPKASGTPAPKRSKVAMHSTSKVVSSLSTCTKQSRVKSTLSGRKLFSPSMNLSKDNKIVGSTRVTKVEELQSSLGMETQNSLPAKGCDETEKVIELLPCSMQELVLSSIHEEDSSSSLHANHSCTKLEEIASSDIADVVIEKTPVNATRSSPTVLDKLKDISNTFKLLNSKPMSVTKHKSDMVADMVGAQYTPTDLPEPKTPMIHLKFEHGEDSHHLLKARTTGVKKTMAKECLTFLNSADKEGLKSLKGIGEKRANYILELREQSPEPLKEIDDLKTVIRMNNKEIKTLMSDMFSHL